MANSNPATMQNLREKKKIDDDLKAELEEAVSDFKATRWNSSGTEEVAVAETEESESTETESATA